MGRKNQNQTPTLQASPRPWRAKAFKDSIGIIDARGIAIGAVQSIEDAALIVRLVNEAAR